MFGSRPYIDYLLSIYVLIKYMLYDADDFVVWLETRIAF